MTRRTGGYASREHVPYPSNRLDQRRVLRITFQLLPQSGDLGIDGAIKGLPLATARNVHQPVSVEHSARVPGEREEQVIFASREGNVRTVGGR